MLPFSSAGCAAPAGRRNVLFVNIEDWNAETVGCYGSPIAQTPHFDAFAQTGVRFDRAYCQSSVCGPSRASFLTGTRPDTTGVYKNQDLFDELTPRELLSLPEYFRNAGAYTANIGKLFHGVSERLHSFDRLELYTRPEAYAGVSLTTRPQQELARDELLDEAVAVSDLPRAEAGRMGDSGESAEASPDGQRARMVVRMLEERERETQPFFMALGFQRPHLPFLAPREFVDLYDPASMPAPKAPASADRDVPLAAKRWGVNYGIFEQGPPSEHEARRAVAAYYACVSFMDAQLGLVLDALENTGLAANTIVVVFADHGFHLGEHGLWGKETLFEQTTRVPLAIRVPGARGNGKVSTELVELVDLLPTLLDACEIDAPGQLEGTSLLPLIEDPNTPGRPAAFTVCSRSREIVGRSVRSERYRWSIWSKLDGGYEFELYDLAEDPWEQVNLATSSAHQEIARQHAQLFRTGPSPRSVP